MNILGVIGSPRKGKNTATLVEKVLEGAQDSGYTTETVYLDDLNIGPCKACYSCKHSGICIKPDDMQEIYPKLIESDVLVIGTPVYFDHVSAQLKIFLDRLLPYVGPDMEKRFPKDRKAVIVVTWEAKDPDIYDGVMDWIEERLDYYYGIETIAKLKAADTAKKPVMDDAGLLERAMEVGEKLNGG